MSAEGNSNPNQAYHIVRVNPNPVDADGKKSKEGILEFHVKKDLSVGEWRDIIFTHLPSLPKCVSQKGIELSNIPMSEMMNYRHAMMKAVVFDSPIDLEDLNNLDSIIFNQLGVGIMQIYNPIHFLGF